VWVLVALVLVSVTAPARATNVIPPPNLSTAASFVGTSGVGIVGGQIDSNFQVNFAQAMTTYQAFNILNVLSNQEIYDVAHLYHNPSALTTTIFNTVNAHNGRTAALLIEEKWRLAIAGTASGVVPIPPTGGYPGSLEFTLQEIYLDFRLFGGAAGGPLGVQASLYSTAVFAGTNLVAAGYAGYQLGTGVAWLWQRISPDSWESFSNGVGTVVTDLDALTTAVLDADWNAIGASESGMLNDFETSVTDIGIGPGGAPGPFGVSQDLICDDADTECVQ
jgi:hypothetical protein